MNRLATKDSWTHSEKLNRFYQKKFSLTENPTPNSSESFHRWSESILISRFEELYLDSIEHSHLESNSPSLIRTNRALEESIWLFEKTPFAYIPAPEMMSFDGGGVGLEWFVKTGKVFTVSLMGDEELVYAALLGEGQRAQGVIRLDDSTSIRVLSEQIVSFLKPFQKAFQKIKAVG